MKCLIAVVLSLALTGAGLPVHAQRAREHGRNDGKESSKPKAPKSKLEYSLDTIITRLDNLHLTLNRINDFTTLGLNTKRVERQLPAIGANIDAIGQNLSLSGAVPDFKTLQLYSVLLGNIKDKLETWRNALFRYNIDLISMNNEIDAFAHDSVIHQLIHDTAFRRMYLDELTGLEGKWRQADTATHSHLQKITQLQSVISNYYFQTIDLQNKVDVLRNELSGKIFNKEYAYLWEFRDSGARGAATEDLAARSYEGQRQIMGYFISENWGQYGWVLFAGLLFFGWVWNCFRLIRKRSDGEKVLAETKVNYLRKYPVAAALVVMLSIIPFFDIDAPAAYAHLVQLPLIATLCVMFARRWPRRIFYRWLFIVLLYILFSATNLVLVPRLSVRYWLLLLQLISLLLGYPAVRKMMRWVPANTIVRVAVIAYGIGNI